MEQIVKQSRFNSNEVIVIKKEKGLIYYRFVGESKIESVREDLFDRWYK
jgi:hypothetical protein